MKSRKAVFDRVLSFCREEKLFSRGEKVLIALSGGKDSVTLLHILVKMQAVFSLSLSALHLHHGIRAADADRDEAFCRNLCRAYNIPLHVFHADIPALAKETGRGLEETAREERYRLLYKTADEMGYTKIATAHTASDQSETVLMHLIRGAGMRGLGGIRPLSDRLVRPLLCLTSEDVLFYAGENDLSYCRDKTNEDTRYFRNYVRHRLLPAIKEKNPSADRSFCHFATVAAASDAYFSALAADTLRSWGDTAGGLPLDRLQALIKTPGALLPLEAILTLWLDRSLSFEQVLDALALVQNGREGKTISLGENDVLALKNGFLCKNPAAKNNILPEKLSLKPGYNALPGYAYALFVSLCRTGENCEKISEKGYTFFLSSATIDTLGVRPKADGDKYRAGGQTKHLKKLFSDKKIPPSDRIRWPLVCDGEGIVCAPLLPAADRAIGENIKITFLQKDRI